MRWHTYEHDNFIGIWPDEGVGNSGGYAPMAKVVGDKRWVTDEKRREIAELMASAPKLKEENERLWENLSWAIGILEQLPVVHKNDVQRVIFVESIQKLKAALEPLK